MFKTEFPLYEYTFHSFISWWVFLFQLLWIVLLSIFVHRFLNTCFQTGIYLGYIPRSAIAWLTPGVLGPLPLIRMFLGQRGKKAMRFHPSLPFSNYLEGWREAQAIQDSSNLKKEPPLFRWDKNTRGAEEFAGRTGGHLPISLGL